MELISKLNYDICKIIQKQTNIIFIVGSWFYGNNKNYISICENKFITFHKHIKNHQIHYTYILIDHHDNVFHDDFLLKRFIYITNYKGYRFPTQSIITFKEFFNKVDNINWTFYHQDDLKYPNEIKNHMNDLPEFIYKKNLKKMCIDFLFDENYKIN